MAHAVELTWPFYEWIPAFLRRCMRHSWMRRSAWWLQMSIINRHTGSIVTIVSWWRHQMETFSALLAICAGNSPVPGEFPTQRPVTRGGFDVFFDLRLNKRLSKQWWGWWFETLSRPLWRQCNVQCMFEKVPDVCSQLVSYHNNFLFWYVHSVETSLSKFDSLQELSGCQLSRHWWLSWRQS